MVRRYRTDPVDPDALDRIVAAALSGPTAGNAGGISIVLVTSTETRRALADAAGEAGWVASGKEPWLSAAPAHLVLCAEPDAYRRRYGRPDKDPAALEIPWWWVDAGAALALALGAAVDEGLGAGFLGGHSLPGVGGLLGIPEDVEVVGLITIGHPLPEQPTASQRRGRRPPADRLHRERWGGEA